MLVIQVEVEEFIAVGVKGERTNFAHHSRTDPPGHIGQVVSPELTEFDLDSVQIGALVTPLEKIVHELPEVSGRPWAVRSVTSDEAQAKGGPPEVAPAPGEHARLHGFLRRESGEDFLKNAVGEGAEAVGAAHSFEHAVGVIGAARQEEIKRRDGAEEESDALRRRLLTSSGRRRSSRHRHEKSGDFPF